MKKFFTAAAFILIFSSVSFAGEEKKLNTELLIELNKGVVFCSRVKVQYQSHQKNFHAQMPYVETIAGKNYQINMLKELVVKLGGKVQEIDETEFVIPDVPSIEDALLLDAAEEIDTVAYCNLLKYKYNDPEVNKVVEQIKDQSQYYYMLYDNIAQLSIMTMLRRNEMPASPMPRHNPNPEEIDRLY